MRNPAPTTLVFLPGLAADHRMWRAQLEAAEAALDPARWRIRVSDVHTHAHRIETMAQALLAAYPAGPLVLCGASMGGMVAMEVARQAPNRVHGLALLGTNARPETPDVRALREAAMQRFREGRAMEVLQANVPLAFHPDAQAKPEVVADYLQFVMDAGAAQLVRQNQAVIERPDARLHLAQLRCPVLVMCGDSDQLTPPACSEEITQHLPQATQVLLPRCGHMLTLERPQEVNAQLLAWLRTL
jgi:pimeloyl-ACP methyl ester carboxylesterase